MSEPTVYAFAYHPETQKITCQTCDVAIGTASVDADTHVREVHGIVGIVECKAQPYLLELREQPWGRTLRDVTGKIQLALMMAGARRDLWMRIGSMTFFAERCEHFDPELSRELGRDILNAARSISQTAWNLVGDVREFGIGEMNR